jgi:WD40 repeat protein
VELFFSRLVCVCVCVCVCVSSLHPNGYTLASAGNDGMVQLWDIRKFGDSRNNAKTKTPKPVATQQVGLSISSAYFSPSGNSLVSTSNANRLDLFNNAHLEKGKMKATYSINHNNQTGRWLSTFMATWHPQLDIFVVGSMNRPRSVEAYDAQGKQLVEVRGEALGSVMSRCCFHPSTDKIIMVGGNSSGRVVAIR